MASTYTMVAYGSQGSAVKQLQNELNKRGYSLDEDGVFGKKTRAAVRDYQKKNGLKMVDGIAGDETWGSLMAQPEAEMAAVPEIRATESTLRRLQELEKGYKPSDEVTAALVPELRQAALAEYRMEGQALEEQYDMLTQREKQEYDRWQDTVGQWQKLLAAAQSEYEDAGSRDRKSYQEMLKHYADKAEEERRLAAKGIQPADGGDGGRDESLSSVAADSLQRAVGNYLKRGNGDLAQALAAQYADRMTPAQRRQFEKLLAQYGMSL